LGHGAKVLDNASLMNLFLSCRHKFSFMHKWIISCFLLPAITIAAAQEKILPEEARQFVLPGFEMLDYIPGDINNDGQPDALLVLKQKGEDSMDLDANRPLIILTRQANGKLGKAIQNDSAILCLRCGGVFGDPYEGISIEKNGFEISFYGGSSWRWYYHYTFSFDASKNNWYLSRQEEGYYHNTEIDETQKDATIEKEELGDISFASFNANFNFPETKWKVTAAKTFFYNNPKLGSKPRKGYLIKGDVVSSYKQYKNFIQVDFTNKKERSSSGFILKKDLVKIE
jgi:hypothetical protein